MIWSMILQNCFIYLDARLLQPKISPKTFVCLFNGVVMSACSIFYVITLFPLIYYFTGCTKTTLIFYWAPYRWGKLSLVICIKTLNLLCTAFFLQIKGILKRTLYAGTPGTNEFLKYIKKSINFVSAKKRSATNHLLSIELTVTMWSVVE